MPVEHHRSHPDVHQPWAEWSEEQTLHVAVSYSNPFRWDTRRRLANNFRRWLEKCPNVRMHFGELAYGDRPHEVTDRETNPDDVQLRTNAELFHKENIYGAVIPTFPPGWKYGCVIDADFHMTRHDWALETIHQLQHYAFVQPFSSYVDLSGNMYGARELPLRMNTSFFFNYINNGFKVSPLYFNGQVNADHANNISLALNPDAWQCIQQNGVAVGSYEGTLKKQAEDDKTVFMRGTGATGGALAFRRESYDACGGLMTRCILGHGDWYMAFGLLDIEPPDIHVRGYSPEYIGYIREWRRRARAVTKNVGYTDGHAIHHFHGSKFRRAYSTRDLILVKHNFGPYSDIFADWQGIFQLAPEKPEMRDDIRQYFISRSEDDPTLSRADKLMV